MSQQEFNKELVRRWFAAFPDLDDAAFETFVHPDIVNHPAPLSLKNGLENFKKVLMYVNAAVPDQTYRCEELVAEGSLMAARTRWWEPLRARFSAFRAMARGSTSTRRMEPNALKRLG